MTYKAIPFILLALVGSGCAHNSNEPMRKYLDSSGQQMLESLLAAKNEPQEFARILETTRHSGNYQSVYAVTYAMFELPVNMTMLRDHRIDRSLPKFQAEKALDIMVLGSVKNDMPHDGMSADYWRALIDDKDTTQEESALIEWTKKMETRMRWTGYRFEPVSACTSTKNINSATMPVKNHNTEQTETSLKDNIYFYQHKLLPNWTFETNGEFYKDIVNGDLSRVKSVAEEVISAEYANSISAELINKFSGVLFTFPEPSNPSECYFVFIRHIDNRYLYITYEKTIDFLNEGYIGVVGRWSSDGSHSNYGPRKYSDLDSFLSDAIEIR